MQPYIERERPKPSKSHSRIICTQSRRLDFRRNRGRTTDQAYQEWTAEWCASRPHSPPEVSCEHTKSKRRQTSTRGTRPAQVILDAQSRQGRLLILSLLSFFSGVAFEVTTPRQSKCMNTLKTPGGKPLRTAHLGGGVWALRSGEVTTSPSTLPTNGRNTH